MRTILIPTMLTASLFVGACTQPPLQEEETSLEPETGEVIDNNSLMHSEIFKVDGCEYIICKERIGTTREYGYMAHKGNCNNPIHCYQTPDTVSDTLETTDTIPILTKKDQI